MTISAYFFTKPAQLVHLAVSNHGQYNYLHGWNHREKGRPNELRIQHQLHQPSAFGHPV